MFWRSAAASFPTRPFPSYCNKNFSLLTRMFPFLQELSPSHKNIPFQQELFTFFTFPYPQAVFGSQKIFPSPKKLYLPSRNFPSYKNCSLRTRTFNSLQGIFPPHKKFFLSSRNFPSSQGLPYPQGKYTRRQYGLFLVVFFKEVNYSSQFKKDNTLLNSILYYDAVL